MGTCTTISQVTVTQNGWAWIIKSPFPWVAALPNLISISFAQTRELFVVLTSEIRGLAKLCTLALLPDLGQPVCYPKTAGLNSSSMQSSSGDFDTSQLAKSSIWISNTRFVAEIVKIIPAIPGIAPGNTIARIASSLVAWSREACCVYWSCD